jgi:uncharacterized protein (TIGR03437 family)
VDVPIFYASPLQINAQLPSDLPANTRLQAAVKVRQGIVEVLTVPETITLALTGPGIFVVNAAGQGAILDGLGRLVDSQTPAKVGDTVAVFGTGLGATQPAVAPGQAAPGNPPATVVTLPTVRIGGLPAPVVFAGLAPGFVGLYQINVQIPPGTPAGSAVELVLTQSGTDSNKVTLAIR